MKVDAIEKFKGGVEVNFQPPCGVTDSNHQARSNQLSAKKHHWRLGFQFKALYEEQSAVGW